MKERVPLMLATVLLLGADAPKEPAVPELNRKVLEFAKANLGKKVGDGECATLASQALQTAEARRSSTTPEGEYVWGKLVRTVTAGTSLTGDVSPGDILQFRKAVFAGAIKGGTVESSYPQHTAIVAAVKNDGKVVEILHQNVGTSGESDKERRIVQKATIRFDELRKGGSVKIYRPVPREGGGGREAPPSS